VRTRTLAPGASATSPCREAARAAARTPGSVYYNVGDHGAGIRQWQLQMRHRGAPLTGTGSSVRTRSPWSRRCRSRTVSRAAASWAPRPGTWPGPASTARARRPSPSPSWHPNRSPLRSPLRNRRRLSTSRRSGPPRSTTRSATRARRSRPGSCGCGRGCRVDRHRPVRPEHARRGQGRATAEPPEGDRHPRPRDVEARLDRRLSHRRRSRRSGPPRSTTRLGDHSATIKTWQLRMRARVSR